MDTDPKSDQSDPKAVLMANGTLTPNLGDQSDPNDDQRDPKAVPMTSGTLTPNLGGASDTPELIRAVGGSVTFRSHNTDTKGNAAFWDFGTNAIVTVIFEDPPRPVFSKEEFKTRFTVSERGRALSISQLRMEDAGTYSVNIEGKKSTFTLLVYSHGHLWDEGSVVLAVNKSSLDKLDTLMCTARNAVSSRSVTITVSEGLCPGESPGKVEFGMVLVP
ncbi:hypothetical protein HGM15179_020956 [Zosterops borbonicus]|uniref:Immunoglobulin subtype domain-containing protein n=1 Tax=Zosterops borbonicus TaxID=364589 RepID=A0A8K1D9D3_9PASS|nr:hypothetical protein HGM15179_020956 [Zosterops borbonicus]